MELPGKIRTLCREGMARAKHRALEEDKSSAYHPVLRNDLDEPLKPGDIVPLEIALCPSATFYHAGEILRLIVASSDIVHGPIFNKDTSVNSGLHVLHIGGDYDSYLLLPVVPAKKA